MMKHVTVISKGPEKAQLGIGEILSIVATALSAIAAIFTASSKQ
jgi:hypothetical protein